MKHLQKFSLIVLLSLSALLLTGCPSEPPATPTTTMPCPTCDGTFLDAVKGLRQAVER